MQCALLFLSHSNLFQDISHFIFKQSLKEGTQDK